MVMRFCNRCGETKPLDQFGKNPGMADGYLNQCIECRRVWSADYRNRNRDKIREYQRTWENQPHIRKKAASRLVEWKNSHPVRRRAQNALNNGIRDGLVFPWPVCALPDCNRKPHAHHPDYAAPLSVVWLCPEHHMQAHSLV